MFGFKIGGSATNTKDKSFIDDKTSGAQWQNYERALAGLLPNYQQTSGSQIQSLMDPYVGSVVQGSLAALDQVRQRALHGVGDQAGGAGAFGGSRHGVADALTNSEFADKAGLLVSQLMSQGYGQALGAAQQENQYGYQYPLDRQGLLNQTLAGIEPIRFNVGKQRNIYGEVNDGKRSS